MVLSLDVFAFKLYLASLYSKHTKAQRMCVICPRVPSFSGAEHVTTSAAFTETGGNWNCSKSCLVYVFSARRLIFTLEMKDSYRKKEFSVEIGEKFKETSFLRCISAPRPWRWPHLSRQGENMWSRWSGWGWQCFRKSKELENRRNERNRHID